MARYKNSTHLHSSNNSEFDTPYSPGVNTPRSGIYRCDNCGREIASNVGNPLPPQSHNQHSANNGPIQWRLIVATESTT